MSHDIEKYRNWIRQAQYTRSTTFYFMSIALIEQLGKERGTANTVRATVFDFIVDIVEEGKKRGSSNRIWTRGA